MATKAKESQTKPEENKTSEVVKTAEKDVRPVQQFFAKFGNDGVMIFSAALAYNLLMAMFPIAIAILAILGFVLGNLSPAEYINVKAQILHVVPVSLGPVLDSATKQLARASGILSIIAVVLALFNGSRLFVLIEYCFGIIYHVRQRPVIKQNLTAIGMLLIFLVLIPIMTFASAAPAVVLSILPGSSVLDTIGGILGGLIASYLLFQAIYMVVPNQKISFRNSWLGSVVSAIALQIYLTLFPYYVQHFLSAGYAASIASFIFLLIFFYYFAVILLIGAEVNAFFSEKVKATPTDLVTMVHITTSHLPKTKDDKEQQAAQSHKDAPIGTTATQSHVDDTIAHRDVKAYASLTTATGPDGSGQEQHAASAHTENGTKEDRKAKKDSTKPKKTSSNKVESAVEAIAGTALAFGVETLRMRRSKPKPRK